MNSVDTEKMLVGYSAEDQCYLAQYPELPYFVAFGETEAEAIQELKDSYRAIEEALAVNSK